MKLVENVFILVEYHRDKLMADNHDGFPDHSKLIGLFRMGGISAIIIVLVFFLEMVVVVKNGFPPTNIQDWFSLFQSNRLVGILESFALDIIAVAFHAPLYLALYFLLRKSGKGYSTLVIAVVFALIGMAVYFATNISFSLLYLSDQYSLATTEAQRLSILSAGNTLLALFNGTGPFAAYALYAIAGILISIVMLKSGVFNKTTAIIGIIGNALELGLPPSIDPAFFLIIDPVLIGIGGVFLIVWYCLISVKLFQQSGIVYQVFGE
jgi:hypothetical protein